VGETVGEEVVGLGDGESVGFIEGAKEGSGDGGFDVCFTVGCGEGACVILIVG